MEAVFLILLLVLETAFAVQTHFSGYDKGEWYKRRSLVRGVELVCFLLFMLLPGVEFNFRYKLCFWILFIRLVAAVIVWACKRKKDNGTLKIAGLLVRLAGTVCILTAAMLPAFIFTDYDGLDTTGEYEVKQTRAILVDESREEEFEQDGSRREVPVYLFYPDAEEGAFPLVIFSHGAFGYYQSNTSTYMELASNGYVVVSLDHPYHSFFTEDTDGKTIIVDTNFLGEVQSVNASATEEETLALSSKWLFLRAADMNFAIDAIKEANRTDALTEAWHIGKTEAEEEILHAIRLADCDKIGLMGHSLGGITAVSLGRTRDDIGAVIDLDGTMLGEELAYVDGAYIFEEEPYPVPLLSIDNEEHHEAGQEMGTAYVNVAVLAHAKDGKNTYFKGSAHMNFTDLPLFSPFLAGLLGTGSIDSESCIRQMNEIILQYYDYYLKGEGEVTLKECYE